MLRKHKKVVLVLVLVMVALGLALFLQKQDANAPSDESITRSSGKTFDKTKYSTSDPASLWVVVNKSRPLPATYVPTDLIKPNITVRSGGDEGMIGKEAAKALESLVAGAKKADHDLMLVSGYRSYALQSTVYSRYVATLGQTEADRISAKPGTSEHQTGLGVDVGTTSRVCELEVCFGTTPAGKWVAANAYKYGFIVRYLEGKESVTGYSYEPWHLRFVGKELAAEMTRTNTKTMEEFFDL